MAQVGPRRYRLDTAGGHIDVDVDRLNAYESRLDLGGTPFHVVSVAGPANHLVEVEGVSHRIARDEGGLVLAPAPAVLVAVHVAAGDDVEAGAPLVVLESMKMETVLRAPRSGRVREVLAAVNSQVDAGAPLLRIDHRSDEAIPSDAPIVRFTGAASTAEDVQDEGA